MRQVPEIQSLNSHLIQLRADHGHLRDCFAASDGRPQIHPTGTYHTMLKLLLLFKNAFPQEIAISEAHEFMRLTILSKETGVNHLPSCYCGSIFSNEFQNFCNRIVQIDNLLISLHARAQQLVVAERQAEIQRVATERAAQVEAARQAEIQRQAAATRAAQLAATKQAEVLRIQQAQEAARLAEVQRREAQVRAEQVAAAREVELQRQQALQREQEVARNVQIQQQQPQQLFQQVVMRDPIAAALPNIFVERLAAPALQVVAAPHVAPNDVDQFMNTFAQLNQP